MRLLILGGTGFLGRALTENGVRRGHNVSLLNRGVTAPELFPDLELLRADRTIDLSVVTDREWDAVIDVAAYDPDVVSRSVGALCDSTGRYVFVSTVSVYADHRGRQSETEPVLALTDSTPAADLYGARKAAGEDIVRRAFGERALVVRPGLIVGPHDRTDRFLYWPRRIADGGRILAPDSPNVPVQFVDVRDLAEWIVDAVEQSRSGAYNITGHTTTMGRFLDACGQAVVAVEPDLVWIPARALLEAGVDPWNGVPMWIGDPEWTGANQVDVSRALAAGFAPRPIIDTIRDTFEWDRQRDDRPVRDSAFIKSHERQLLSGYMTPDDTAPPGDRPLPDIVGGTVATLGVFIDYVRTGLIRKLDGLDDERARDAAVASGTSLLGLVKHVSAVEVFWLHHAWAGKPASSIPEDELTATDTVASVVDAYRMVGETTRRLLATGAALDSEAAVAPFGPPAKTLRWVLVHLLEETARHAGHADVIREQLDNVTGR